MTRTDLLPYVSFALDDALNVRTGETIPKNARLVVYECGFEPLVVAVWSYLPDTTVDMVDAEEIARDYLEERDWFADDNHDASYVI